MDDKEINRMKIALGRRVNKFRKSRNITPNMVWQKARIAPPDLTKIETGQVFPRLERMLALAQALDCKPGDLLNDL